MATRLEEHRRRFEGDRQKGPLIRVEDLDAQEMAQFTASLMREIRTSDAEDLGGFYGVYVRTLHSWGIMCPHPLSCRSYDGQGRSGTEMSFEESRWYNCSLCGTEVINR